MYEDEAIDDLERAIANNTVGGAPAKTRSRSKGKQPKNTPNKTPVPGAPFSPGGGGQGGPKAAKPKDATQIALAKRHEDRTLQDKKLIACKFEVLGQCKAGAKCEYSHAKAKIDPAKAKLQKTQANKQTLATPAPADAAAAAKAARAKAARTPSPKNKAPNAKPGKRGRGKSPKRTAASVAQALGIPSDTDGTQQGF